MPPLTSGLVLITGASGFLGVHTARALTDAGYRVRAAVRDNAKGDYITSLIPGAEIALVPDMTAPGAYNEAVRGVDAVIHMASSIDLSNAGPPEEMTRPAVEGVLALLEAAATEPRIKRVVEISSIAAVGGDGGLATEEEWNDKAVQACESLGNGTPGPVKYAASKTLAERAFWDFLKTPRSFDGVSLNPALLFGPPAGYPPNKVQGSNSVLVPWLTSTVPESQLETSITPHTDVRDAATAAALVLASPQAGGERFLICAGPTHGNDLAIASERLNDPKLTNGNHDVAYRQNLRDSAQSYSSAKVGRVLGLKLRNTDETFGDAAVGIKKILDAKL